MQPKSPYQKESLWKRSTRHPYFLLAAACLLLTVLFRPTNINNPLRLPIFLLLALVGGIGILLLYCLDQSKLPSLRHVSRFGLLYILGCGVFILLAKSQYPIPMLMTFSFLIVIGIGIYILVTYRMTSRNFCLFLFALAYILCAGYILYTTVTQRAHDVGLASDFGHASYINFFIQNGFTLPDQYIGQFYHPPLHHILSAIWIQIQYFFGIGEATALENAQILTLFYSFASIITSYKILKEINFKGMALHISLAILCLHPTFLLIAGDINNDALVWLFVSISVLFSIRWFKNPTYKNIIIIALALGFGMLSKTSAAMISIGIAFLFAFQFFKMKGERGHLIGQFAVFLVICAPLSLFWSIRELVQLGMPFGYLNPIPSSAGDFSAYSRFERLFIPPDNFTIYHLPSPSLYDLNYMIPLAAIKSSIFGEYSFFTEGFGYASCFIFFVATTMLAVISFIAGIVDTIYVIVKSKKETSSALCSKNTLPLTLFFGIVYWSSMISYIRYCFKSPYPCTEDFRYIIITLLIGVISIGYLLQILKRSKKRISKSLTYAIAGTTFVFCLSSIVVYTMIGTLSY